MSFSRSPPGQLSNIAQARHCFAKGQHCWVSRSDAPRALSTARAAIASPRAAILDAVADRRLKRSRVALDSLFALSGMTPSIASRARRRMSAPPHLKQSGDQAGPVSAVRRDASP